MSSSSNPLGYTGIDFVTQPPADPGFGRAPTSNDWQSYTPGDEVLDDSVSPPIWYKCVESKPNAAVWVPITPATITGISKITPASGTSPVVPDVLGNINLSGSGNITTVGGTNTVTTQLTGLVAHNLLLGSTSSTIENLPPSATAGMPLVSTGATTSPGFGIAVVQGGGTGASSFIPNAPVCAGGSASSPLVSAASGISSSGSVLTSTGATTPPEWRPIGLPSLTQGVQYANSHGVLNGIDGDTAGKVLMSNGTGVQPSFQASPTATITLTGTTGSASGNNISVLTTVSGLSFAGSGSTLTLGGAITVPSGGTGVTSFATSYAPVCAGISPTGSLQLAATGISNANYVLTSTGAFSLPEWKALPATSISISGDSGIASGGSLTLQAAPTGLSVTGSGSTLVMGGTLNVSHGGTGQTSITSYAPVCGGTTTTSPLQSATTGISNVGYVLTSNGSSALPEWKAVSAGSGIVTINGDIGSVTGTTVSFTAVQSLATCGSSTFQASGTAMSLVFSDTKSNTCIGDSSLPLVTTGQYNSSLGTNSLSYVSSGSYNSCIGSNSLNKVTSGIGNVAIGYSSLQNLLTGSRNTALGAESGIVYSGAESDNICLGYHVGTNGESNTLRIGNGSGTSAGQLKAAYISGIAGVSPGSAQMVTINTSTDQLGSQAIPTFPTVTEGLVYSTGSSAYTSISGVPAHNVLISQGAGITPAYSSILFANDVNSEAGATKNLNGGIVQLSVENSDITHQNCSACVTISAQGPNLGSDSFVFFDQGSTEISWQVGVKSPSSTFEIHLNSSLADIHMNGDIAFSISNSGIPSFPLQPLGVSSGGTGTNASLFGHYAPIFSGTSIHPEFVTVTDGIATAGNVLMSNGAGVYPSWQPVTSTGFTQIKVQTFTSDGTYFPTTGMKYCQIEVCGGGGGGQGGGGGGGTGGTSSVGSIVSATGGAGGTISSIALGGIGANGDINCSGGVGIGSSTSQCLSGSSYFGGSTSFGTVGNNYGVGGGSTNKTTCGGGGGGYARKTVSASTIGASQSVVVGVGGVAGAGSGYAGAPGVVIITEYI